MFNFKLWIEDNNENSELDNILYSALSLSGFNILREASWNFSPEGWMKTYLLGESHLAIHTFPENNNTYIELSSCVKQPYDQFIKNINNNSNIKILKESISQFNP